MASHPAAPPAPSETHTDVLGEPFRARTYDLGRADDGDLAATLVDAPPTAGAPEGSKDAARRAVLYVHGFCDYFFQTEMAAWWRERGYHFYALDLRRYGRSLRPGNRANHVTDLAEYDEELGLAYAQVLADGAQEVVVMAHSTGGLITSLWADRARPEGLVGLVLNSPWLDLQGSALMRTLGTLAIDQIGRWQPTRVLERTVHPVYAHSLHRDHGGEWHFDFAWKPETSFPVHLGWLRAIRRGHAAVHRGLEVPAPVLVLASSGTAWVTQLGEPAHTHDIVLDVDQIRRWSSSLGRHVTFVTVPGAKHDVVLSRPESRAVAYAEMDRWLTAYVGTREALSR